MFPFQASSPRAAPREFRAARITANHILSHDDCKKVCINSTTFSGNFKNYTPEPLGNIIDEGKSGVIYSLPVNAEKRIPVLSDTTQLLDQSSLGLT
jgi:hypothetical protein